MVREAPRPAAASRTCCNKKRPASLCNTFGRAERIRVPLPAAMITTFNAMPSPVLRRSFFRPWIIAALLALSASLAGCGVALKIGYGQGSLIAYRWLDGYVDFNDAQARRVRRALDEWFAWHRRTQLPDYADLLARSSVEVLANTTPERVCALSDEIRGRAELAFEHARPAFIDVVSTLTPQQIANVEKKFVAGNETYRNDYMQRDPAERREAAVERETGRAQDLYGWLDEAQKQIVVRGVADSPFDAELAYTERLRRQEDALQLLRRLAAPAANAADGDAEIRGYVQRLDRSPNDDYRRYAVKLVAFNCAFAAALHNGTTAAQRRTAAKRLQGYERDLRDLAAAAAS